MHVLPHHSIGFCFSSDLPLLTLKGVGLQYVESHDYNWDSRTRRDAHCVVQYTLNGEGGLEIEGLHYSVHAGDVFIIDIPGTNRYYLPETSSHWEFLYLEFTKECLPMLRKIYSVAGPVLHLPKDSELPDQIMNIYAEALGDRMSSFFENARVSYDLWLRLTEYAVSFSGSEISKIDLAKSYIDQNYFRNDLDLDQVADHIGMSRSYMCQEFRSKYGISPGKYLREVRISHACYLLMAKSDHTLQEIAEMVGYSNNNYFGKVFKAETGLSPGEYRKRSSQYDFVRTIYETPHGSIYPDAHE